MKRHKPLLGNPDTHREWQQRSQAAALQRARRARPRDTGPTRPTRDLLTARSGGRCEVCAAWLCLVGRQVHHRQPRGAGGSSRPEINALSCLLDLCCACHRVVELNRAWAKEHGLLVPWPIPPADVPAGLTHGHVLLNDNGGWTPADNHHDPQGTAA